MPKRRTTWKRKTLTPKTNDPDHKCSDDQDHGRPCGYGGGPQAATLRGWRSVVRGKDAGQTLYGELITAIVADPTLATEADLKELRDDYIAPYIAWAVYLQSLSRLYAEFDRNGAHYKNDGNTVQADAAWLRMEQATARDNSDKYADRLLDFLKDNSDTGEPFASWRTVTDTEQGERINKTYGVGIVTRRSKWQNSQR